MFLRAIQACPAELFQYLLLVKNELHQINQDQVLQDWLQDLLTIEELLALKIKQLLLYLIERFVILFLNLAEYQHP